MQNNLDIPLDAHLLARIKAVLDYPSGSDAEATRATPYDFTAPSIC